jgi:hypothetical protein
MPALQVVSCEDPLVHDALAALPRLRRQQLLHRIARGHRSGSALTVFTPEELAWEMGVGKVTLIQEPVPLFERAVSATLEYLAEQKAKRSTA